MLTPQTPRQIKTQLVKENILKVTTELIKNYGIEYVTVNNICKTANVSTGSFYHHFGNKDELLAYYLVDAFEKRSADLFPLLFAHFEFIQFYFLTAVINLAAVILMSQLFNT